MAEERRPCDPAFFADVAPGPTIAPTFLNAWVNFGINCAPAGYYKSGGRLWLAGTIKSGVVGLMAFNVPVGYRSPYLVFLATVSNDAFGLISAYQNGDIVVSVGNNAYVSLDGLSYKL